MADTQTQSSKYTDQRSAFWQNIFENHASDYTTYLEDSKPDHAQRWRQMEQKLPALSDTEIERLTGFGRKLNVLVYSGVWCGDCVRQVPMIRQLAEAAASDAPVRLRIIDRDVNPELTEELRIVGAMRVPMVVFLTEDFWEVGRFGDRLLTRYRLKAEREVGAACAIGYAAVPDDELHAERNDWLDTFERMLLMVRLSPPLRERYGD